MDAKAVIKIGATDETGAAFRSLQSNLNKTATVADSIKSGMVSLGVATAAAVTVAYLAFDRLVKKAGEFQDMAEKTGDTAQNIASLAVAAGVAGTSMDSLVGAANKLTKNLTGVDDESAAAGAAISALGLNLADFKQLAAADQFSAVAKALDGFQDGASKSAVAMALWGKSGAEILPFLKELSGETGRQNILTSEQIKLADEYADKQAKLRTQLGLYSAAIASDMLLAYNAFTEVLVDVAKEILSVDSASKKLGQGGEIKEFAQQGALAMARLADSAFAVAQGVRVVTESYGAAAAAAAAFGQGDFSGANAILNAAREQGDTIKFNLGLLDRLEAKFAQMNKPVDPTNYGNEGRGISATGNGKPKPKYTGAAKKDGKDTSAAEAKAQRDLDIENIKKQGDLLASAFSNSERIMEALRAAGQIDESDYYQKKLAFLSLTSTAQEDALSKEIARLQQEKLSGKEKLDNDKKIVDAQAELAKLRQTSAASVEVLKIQETGAMRAIAQSYRDAEDAAKDYLETIRKAQMRDLAGIGAGTQERERTAGRAQIEDKYSQQRRDLDKSRRDAELGGTFGVDAQKKYDDQLARIKRYQATALSEYDTYYAARLSQEGNWANGASEALKNYFSEASNIAKQTENVFSNAFKGMEDALVDFVKTGKLDFSSLADSIITDLIRIQVRQAMSSAMGGGSGGAGGGFNLVGMLSSIFGGGKAVGGPVSAGMLYEVNEKGPELLNVAGKQYLMMGGQSGSITPNKDSGGGQSQPSIVVHQNFTVGDVATIGMVRQAVAGSEARIASAYGRAKIYGGA